MSDDVPSLADIGFSVSVPCRPGLVYGFRQQRIKTSRPLIIYRPSHIITAAFLTASKRPTYRGGREGVREAHSDGGMDEAPLAG